MSKKLLTIVAVLLAGSAFAQSIIVQVQDFDRSMGLIASQLAFTPLLPEGGLEAVWPEEVGDIGELASVVASINDVRPLDRLLGQATGLRNGDIVILTATEEPVRWEASLCVRGSGSWTNDELGSRDGIDKFIAGCSESGISIVPSQLLTLDGFALVAAVEDPEAFLRFFSGTEAAPTQGEMVILYPGVDETPAQSYSAAGEAGESPIGLEVDEDQVTLVK